LPWKVGDFVFVNMIKIDEFTNHFHNLNLKYVENIRGFDPNGIFVEHMLTMGFSSSFIHTVLGEEEDNNLGNPTNIAGDLETVLSTNELYKHRGKGPSETITPKISTPQSNALAAHPYKKVTNSISGGGGDKNPPSGKIEISHKLPLRRKRKNIVQEEEEHRVKSDITKFSLEGMELETTLRRFSLTLTSQDVRPTRTNHWKLFKMRYLMNKNHLHFRVLSLTMNLKK
jgi:hypothetical protein